MIGNDWDEKLAIIWRSEGFNNFLNLVVDLYKKNIIFPAHNDIFNAFKYTSYKDVKVVIIGQDPYHGVNQAQGLSFSVPNGIKLPPSLKNIYKELYDDLNIIPSDSGNLLCWAKQGVLLINSVLTVEKDKPGSHQKLGWQKFTDYVIQTINLKEEPVVFILWGNYAKAKKNLISNPKHLIIESAHPSPFSASNGFFGSKPFSKANEFLKKNNLAEIDWQIKS